MPLTEQCYKSGRDLLESCQDRLDGVRVCWERRFYVEADEAARPEHQPPGKKTLDANDVALAAIA